MKIAFLNKIDVALFVSQTILIVIGIITIFSTSYSSSGSDFVNFNKQAIFAIVGIVVFFVISLVDYRAIKNYTGIIYVIACIILILVAIMGKNIRGTAGWFDLGFVSLQPAEFVKIAMIIIIAKYFTKIDIYINSFKKAIVSGIYVLIPVSLIMMQPDMGSALIIIFIWIAMLILSGVNKKYILYITILAIVLSGIGWQYALKDYQKSRILSFFDSEYDPMGAGYNVRQSVIAIGSGNIWGKGLGHGSQSQLNFLPEKHTDFIFAVIAEEMGFVGIILVIGLYGIIFYRLLRIAEEAEDNFGKYLVLGTSLLVFFHVVINIGMNMGIMPVTGIPLPLVSYGGSSLVSLMVMFGIVNSVYIKGRGYKFTKEED
ncbi:MAG: rod shape-determining protein RodA [Candidatus Paceibacterota bacterium]|jgi:rod shape determining protein RodA